MENVLQEFNKLKERIKPNPYHFPIVDKWNYKYVYLPNQNKIFLLLLNYLDNSIPFLIEQNINSFINIKDIGKEI